MPVYRLLCGSYFSISTGTRWWSWTNKVWMQTWCGIMATNIIIRKPPLERNYITVSFVVLVTSDLASPLMATNIPELPVHQQGQEAHCVEQLLCSEKEPWCTITIDQAVDISLYDLCVTSTYYIIYLWCNHYMCIFARKTLSPSFQLRILPEGLEEHFTFH